MTSKPRLAYVDGLKGITMVLMIYGHVALFVFHNEASVFNTIIDYARMPLFFIVSGLFAAKVNIGLRTAWCKLRRRLTDQLLPSVVTGVVFCLCSSISLSSALFSLHKAGYWFVWVLVEVYVIFMCFCLLLDALRCSVRVRCLLYLLLALATLPVPSLMGRFGWGNDGFSQVMSAYFVVKYLKFFLAGVVTGHYLPQFQRFISNPYAIGGILVCYAVCVIFSIYTWSVFFSSMFSLVGVLALFCIAQRYRHFFSSSSPVARWFTWVGKFSLEVYLLQYFVFLGLKAIPLPPSFLDTVNHNFLLEIGLYGFLSILVTFASLWMMRLLDTMPMLRRIMLGPKSS